jgi:hypothetical protein
MARYRENQMADQQSAVRRTNTVEKDQTNLSKFWFIEVPLTGSGLLFESNLSFYAKSSMAKIVKMNMKRKSTTVNVLMSSKVLHIVLRSIWKRLHALANLNKLSTLKALKDVPMFALLA